MQESSAREQCWLKPDLSIVHYLSIVRLSVVIIAVVLVVTTFNFTPGSVHIFNRRHPALFSWTILRVITAFYKCVVLSLTNLKRAMMHVAHHISFITFFFSSVFFAVFPWYSWTAIETSKAEASWKWPKESFSTHGKKCGVTHGNGAFLWRYVIKLYFVHWIKGTYGRYDLPFICTSYGSVLHAFSNEKINTAAATTGKKTETYFHWI